jgi:hypothetical protein
MLPSFPFVRLCGAQILKSK